jgi:hypothetical protein
MVVSAKSELLECIEPFSIRTGRRPGAAELERIERLIRELENESATPANLARIAGTWDCLFTTSRFVLGLNKLPLLALSAVHQIIEINQDGLAGYYLNIAELSRVNEVRLTCGEYAAITLSPSDPQMLDVHYQWFYVAMRALPSRQIRVPFHKSGWQRHIYMDNELRIVRGNEGGLFILERSSIE